MGASVGNGQSLWRNRLPSESTGGSRFCFRALGKEEVSARNRREPTTAVEGDRGSRRRVEAILTFGMHPGLQARSIHTGRMGD
jgi:hypothetical protein